MGACYSRQQIHSRRLSITDNIPADPVQNVESEANQAIEDCLSNFTVTPNSQVKNAPAVNLESEANQAIEDCLRNPTILKRILEHFSNTELLQLSFVNKLWNYEARSVNKKRGNLLAHLQASSEDELHKKMQAFGQDLQRMNIAPFSGLSIDLLSRYPGPCGPCPTGALEITQNYILDRLSLKYFSVRLSAYRCQDDCPILLLIKSVLHHFSQVLETLTIDVDGQPETFMQKIVQYCDFGRLKILKLDDKLRLYDESYIYFVRVLLSRAPNLQDLQVNGDMNQLRRLLAQSPAAIDYGNKARAPFNEIPDSAIGDLRLHKLRLEYTGPQFNFERFNRITPILLEMCCATTLRELILDAVLAVPLMCYEVSLENVKRLEMHINYSELELLEPRLLTFVKNFDFHHIFPSLDKVTVGRDYRSDGLSPSHMDTIVHEAYATLWEPLPWRASNIKQLDLRDTLSNDTAQFFAEMFPNVEQLDMTVVPEDFSFGSIWKNWKDLKRLRVYGKNCGNVSSVFCGIFPEEIAEMRDQAVETLERVQVVPIMPAAAPSLKCPRDFTLVYCQSQDHTLIFTKKTGLIAWPRRPTLAATFKTTLDDVCEAWQHIETYASVFRVDDCPDSFEAF